MIAEPFTEASFDFAAENGATHIVDSKNRRILHRKVFTMMQGSFLIAGLAKKARFDLVGTIPRGAYWHFNEDQWVGVEEDETITLFDLKNGCDQGFIFFPDTGEQPLTIHPEGHLIARLSDGNITLHMPDDKVLSSTQLPPQQAIDCKSPITFSACGCYLWVVSSPKDGDDCLMLLEVPSLKVLDQIDVPMDVTNPYDTGPYWAEVILKMWPSENLLVLSRFTDYRFLSLTFHSPDRGKIRTSIPGVRYSTLAPDDDSLWVLAFHPGGDRFATYNCFCGLLEWSWPDCRVTGIDEDCVPWPVNESVVVFEALGEMAYLGDQLVVGNEIFDSGDLTLRGRILHDGLTLLPNGMFRRDSDDCRSLLRLGLGSEAFPVVVELAEVSCKFIAVFEKQRGQWFDISDEVAWIDTPFSRSNQID